MNVHPTAIIHPHAQIASNVSVGPYSLIGENVELGDGTEVMSHAVVDGHTRMGKNNRVFPFASIGLAPQDLKYNGEPTRVEIGDGNAIREFVTIHRGTVDGDGVTRIGSNNLLMAYVHIAHDCKLGDYVIMANGASLAGHVEIQDHATVGAFTMIHQFCRIGAYSFLGSATLVNQDILPYSKTSAPRPVEVYGANRLGLERRGLTKEDQKDLEAAFRLLTRSKLNTTQALEAIEAKGFQSPHVKALVDFIKSSERGVTK
ncbi:MAG: acyl-ACP--UDP-N-acetylglucosamine O-acyltransferase [Acidobacteriota bacterium]|nr:acyl-ACP--UDP-N-acetylglucosamine O-acyltransferase [Acidobacteriota bacterium]